jgi:NAD kinase
VDIVAENDVVVEKLARDRQASLAIYVSGRLFASYSADAVIVATPTGSTAYSFSAGGPVLSPQLDALVFTPVAAHMALNHSLVLAADEPVSIRVLECSGRVAVSVDGQLRGVPDPGDWIRVYGPQTRPARPAQADRLPRAGAGPPRDPRRHSRPRRRPTTPHLHARRPNTYANRAEEERTRA